MGQAAYKASWRPLLYHLYRPVIQCLANIASPLALFKSKSCRIGPPACSCSHGIARIPVFQLGKSRAVTCDQLRCNQVQHADVHGRLGRCLQHSAERHAFCLGQGRANPGLHLHLRMIWVL